MVEFNNEEITEVSNEELVVKTKLNYHRGIKFKYGTIGEDKYALFTAREIERLTIRQNAILSLLREVVSISPLYKKRVLLVVFEHLKKELEADNLGDLQYIADDLKKKELAEELTEAERNGEK